MLAASQESEIKNCSFESEIGIALTDFAARPGRCSLSAEMALEGDMLHDASDKVGRKFEQK